jgi:hypothetical protein
VVDAGVMRDSAAQDAGVPCVLERFSGWNAVVTTESLSGQDKVSLAEILEIWMGTYEMRVEVQDADWTEVLVGAAEGGKGCGMILNMSVSKELTL